MHAAQAQVVKSSLSNDDKSSFFLTTQLKSLLVQPLEKAKDRLLEYNIDLNYQCDDFHKSREQVVHIISKYSFIRYAKTEARHSAYMIVTAAIDACDIYKFLADIDKVGKLVSKSILVTDLTENMVIAQRKICREEIRIDRQRKASANISSQ